jgi:hypothetical protein
MKFRDVKNIPYLSPQDVSTIARWRSRPARSLRMRGRKLGLRKQVLFQMMGHMTPTNGSKKE